MLLPCLLQVTKMLFKAILKGPLIHRRLYRFFEKNKILGTYGEEDKEH